MYLCIFTYIHIYRLLYRVYTNKTVWTFMSYNWGSQEVVLEIVKELKARGYAVWLDLEKMMGDMNKRMAEAVEGAAVVCPVITSKYKCSANCMKERKP